jgi:diguanylate cyclase (GGDEF)-like protein
MLHEGGSVPETLKVNPAFISLLSLSDHPLEMLSLAEQPDLRVEAAYFEEMKIALLAPLKAKDQVIGVLIIGKKLSGEGFAPGENDFIATLTSLAALALRNARHYEQAITDDMTKLFLKRYFQLRLIDEIKRAARYDSKVALLMLDIDHFKRINDTYGHPRGDDVLIGISKAIKANFRDVDIPARFGGEEFSVIMPEVTKADAWVAAERLRKTIESLSFEFNGHKVSLTISIGIAEFPDDAQNPIQLVEKADAALYRSKQSGRNQTHLS